jgi:hypothetical protein
VNKGRKGFKRDFYKLFDIGLKPDDLPTFSLHRSTIERYFREYRQEQGGASSNFSERETRNKSAIQYIGFIRELQDKNLNLAAGLGAATERVRNLESQIKLLTAPQKPWWKRMFKLR